MVWRGYPCPRGFDTGDQTRPWETRRLRNSCASDGNWTRPAVGGDARAAKECKFFANSKRCPPALAPHC